MPRITIIDDEVNHWIDLDRVTSVAFSHDDKWVASGSDAKSVRLRCIVDSSKTRILQGHTGMYVR